MSEPSNATVLEVATPHCATEAMQDEVVALNVETGIYFSMRDLGAALWNDLAAGHSVESLASQVQSATGSDAALKDFVSQICQHGLMRSSGAGPSAADSAVAAALQRGQHAPILEIYEDMKDLLLSDPIHDVDETKGWPSSGSAS